VALDRDGWNRVVERNKYCIVAVAGIEEEDIEIDIRY